MDQRLRYGGRCPGCHRFVDSLDMSRMGLSPWIINTWIENPILSRKKTASVWRQNSFFLFSPPRPKRDVNKKRNDPTLQLDIVHVYFYMFHTYKILVIYVPCFFLIPRNLCNPIVPSGLSLTTVKNGAWSYGTSKKDAFPCDLAAGVGRMLHRVPRDFRHLCASTTGRGRHWCGCLGTS